MTMATKKYPPAIPATAEQVVTLTAAQVAKHPDIRDPGRDLDSLAKSIAEVGVLFPLIVVPVDQVVGEWPRQSLTRPLTGTADRR